MAQNTDIKIKKKISIIDDIESITNDTNKLNINKVKDNDNSTSLNDIFIEITKKIKKKEETETMWDNSEYKVFTTLTSNNRGVAGEEFINEICKTICITGNICGLTTKGQCNDGNINDKTIEIKTAYLGNSGSFQHELGEEPWKAQFMIFVDVSPTQIYITPFINFDEKKYKSEDKLVPYFPTKTITWRKGKGAFKLDTTEKINNENVKIGQCVIIGQNTNVDDIKKIFFKLFK